MPHNVTLSKRGINWQPQLWATGCDWTGGDIYHIKKSSSECGGFCAQSYGCTHFTWSSYNGGMCWMKGGPVYPEEAIYTGDQSMVCGYMNEVFWEGKNWARNCDWPDNGDNIGNVRSNSAECGQKCADHNGCTHFTWSSYNGGTCWFKGGYVGKKKAFRTTDASMVCGVLYEPPIPATVVMGLD
ncbi:hypothetical protein HK098_003083 [Nowakowskiella sp. JEL0407]|nr:hypothetical protein HK098_003083 [Nowakowskiella sp. JEL0407]